MNLRLFLASCLICLTGCTSSLINQHVKDQEVLRGLAMQVSNQLAGSGQISGSAQAINPGVHVSASLTYEAEARYAGLAGQFAFGKFGTTTMPVSEADAALVRAISNDTSLTEAQKRAQLMAIFGKLADKALNPTSQPTK